MTRVALVILLILVFLVALLVGKAYHSVPLKELKRRARSGKDSPAAALYRVAVYGRSLEFFLWIVGSVAAASLLLMAANEGGWLVVVLLLVLAWLVLFGRGGRTAWKLAALAAPLVARILYYIEPLFSRFGSKKHRPHTGIYEREDLLQLLKDQNRLSDSRVPESDLKIAFHALTFGDKTVGQVMTPLRMVKLVAAGEAIGPLLMDELHESGFSRFPVVKDSVKSGSPQIIGTLYIRDLVGHTETGKVRDLMKPQVYFINEDNSLHQALDAFLKMHHHLLVVVNSFEEIVGVLSMEDVLEQILGQKIAGEFDRYDDLRAVAGHQAQKQHSEHGQTEVE